MLRANQTQTNFFSILYNRIPENHLLKRIANAVDFSFINELVADSYCKTFGRPAKEPELMAKLCILERLYDLSDVRVVEEANCNLAYLWFLGLNPDDPLPDASLLAKFRTQRLKDIAVDEILTEIVRQCVEKGIVKQGTTLSVDTTHTVANCKKQVPERIMKHLAARILAALKTDHDGKLPNNIDTNIPDYKGIEDHKEAKRVMKEYLEKTIESAEPYAGFATKEVLEEVKDILSDEKFILQKGLRSLVDQDARVGYKAPDESFFGYKTEYTMTTDERIITAVDIHSGEYVDGSEFHNLLEKTEKSGVNVEAVTGDKAYFRKDILEELEQKKIESIIPVSASAYRVNEDLFSYNKDNDEWFCRMGNRTVKKKHISQKRNGKPWRTYIYTFDKTGCQNCPHRTECMGKASGGKQFHVSENTAVFYAESQRQKSPEFQKKYRKRAAEEWKNAEMKRFHGLARARGWGLRSMAFQAKFTAIAVNLKRIANLIREKERENAGNIAPISSFFENLWRFRIMKIAT